MEPQDDLPVLIAELQAEIEVLSAEGARNRERLFAKITALSELQGKAKTNDQAGKLSLQRKSARESLQ